MVRRLGASPPPCAPYRYTTAGSNMLATSTLYSSRCGLSSVSGEGTEVGEVLGDRSQVPPLTPPYLRGTQVRLLAERLDGELVIGRGLEIRLREEDGGQRSGGGTGVG